LLPDVLSESRKLDWLCPIWNAFVVVAVLGHGFELVWAATRRTHVLRL